MNLCQLIFVVITLCSATVYIMVSIKKGGAAATLAKTFSSFCFICLGVASFVKMMNSGIYNGTKSGVISGIVLIGLVLGLIGDVLLDVAGKYGKLLMVGGMLAFASEHIVITIASALTDFSILRLGISVVLGFIAAFVVVKAEKKSGFVFDGLELPCIVYASLLAMSGIYYLQTAIFNAKFITMVIGGMLFIASDSFLSFIYFKKGLKNRKLFSVLCLSTYYIGQILYALSIGYTFF